MDGQIFISYRRDDSQAWAGRIYDRLSSHLASNHIFMDVDKIDPGVDFIDAIEESIGSCDALIAVIGRRWLISDDEEGRRRVDNPEDFVRIEIATALERGVRVIPVLVDGALMPRSGDLPDELKRLARRQAVEIRHDRFDDDCKRLIAALERALQGARAEQQEKERLQAEQQGKERKGQLEALRPPSLERLKNESPSKKAIQDSSRKGTLPLVKAARGQRILAISAGLVILAAGLVLILGSRQEKGPYPPPVATPKTSGTPMPSGAESTLTVASTPVVATPTTLSPITTPASLASSMAAATKENPFVNSLGMKFVPVPGTNVLFSLWETRVKDYQAFCDATGRSWEKPDFPQTGDHPAVNVSWDDATAFCEWLSQREGNKYRLPTDREWSCAVGIGDREDAGGTPKSKAMKVDNVFPWGEHWPPPNDAGNYFGQECKTSAALAALKAVGYDTSMWVVIEGFNDGNVFTAVVGSFRPNELGIYDLGGNVWEWCQDEVRTGSGLAGFARRFVVRVPPRLLAVVQPRLQRPR